MADKLSAEHRSRNMAAIRSKNMKPELAVRSLVHNLGFRFRLHKKELPGKPDLVFSSLKKAIFVHGCFWHQHNACREGRMPGSRQEYWIPKLSRNVARDAQHIRDLKKDGWNVLIIWECETKEIPSIQRKILKFLGSKTLSSRRK